MTPGDDYWSRLAGRAASVYERAGPDACAPPGAGPADTGLAGERLRAWQACVAGEDSARFTRRLAWDGFDERLLEPLLADGTPGDLPSWMPWFRLFLTGMQAVDDDGQPGGGRDLGLGAVQFQELISGAVGAVGRELRVRTGEAHARLAASALDDLGRQLLPLLSRLASPALEHEFATFRATVQTSIHAIVREQTPGPHHHVYDAFVDFFRTYRAVDFFLENAALARLIGEVVEHWLDAKTEFVLRLASDAAALESRFGAGRALGRVVRIADDRSDRHRRGRTVMICAFESGVRIVYKPKSLAAEVGFHALLGSLNDLLGRRWFRVLRHVDRPEHGWVEYIAHRPCAAAGDVRVYYERAGALLCVLYALEAGDCHFENLVADGEFPVLVDMETVMQPPRDPWRSAGTPPAYVVAMRRLRRSVLATGLLPSWVVGPTGEAFDVSGFGCVEEHPAGSVYPVWENPNTDGMERRYLPGRVRPRANVPYLGERVMRPVDHLEEIVRGFRTVYIGMLAARADILSADAPIRRLASAQIRVVLRSTRIYTELLRLGTERAFVGSGIERGAVLDRMSRYYSAPDGSAPPDWPVFRDEFASLLRFDVPFFAARATDTDLTLEDGRRLEGFFTRSAFDTAIEKIESLSPEDLDAQDALIRAAFLLTERTQVHVEEPGAPAPSAGGRQERPRAAEYVALAEEIAGKMAERAIAAEDGSRSWVCANELPHGGHYHLRPVDETLFAGSTGIALFFAALHAVVGDERWRELAYSALATLRGTLARQGASAGGEGVSLGAGVGVGSIVYGLAAVGEWLGDPRLLDEAELAARSLTAPRVASDGAFDVVYGSAGAILGLARLRAARPGADVREVARRCGDHLLERRSDPGGGLRSWSDPQGSHPSGFSHGAAGIAYALYRLHTLVPDAAYLAAAEEAMAFERSLRDAGTGAWLPASGRSSGLVSWCRGGTGIGLARLGVLAHLDRAGFDGTGPGRAHLLGDLEACVEETLRYGLTGVDHLCCGNLGRVEFLHTAGRALARPHLVDTAHDWAGEVVRSAGDGAGFRVSSGLPAALNHPGLFQGLAGVGYAFLRLARPDAVANLLLFD